MVLEDLPDEFDVVLLELGGEQSLLAGVAAEDVAEAGGEDDAEPKVLERPHGMLAGGAGAEVGARDEDGAAREVGVVEDEVLGGAPAGRRGRLRSRCG